MERVSPLAEHMILSKDHPSPGSVRQPVYLWIVITMSHTNLQPEEAVADAAGRTRRSLNGHLNSPCDCAGQQGRVVNRAARGL